MNTEISAGKKSGVSRYLKLLLPFVILALGAGIILYYIIGPAEGYMTSDCTDSLRWAYATYESGRLISDDFYYAAILPFGGNLIFLPYIAVFGYSMTSQICGLVTMAVLLVAALWYLATGIGLDKLSSAGLVAVTVLILSSSPKLREIMWEHIFYYNLGILFFCFGFGLVSRILREGGLRDGIENARPIDWVRVVIICVFSLLAATDGLQTLVCFTLPLLAGFFAERFFDPEEKLLAKKNINTLLFLFAVLFSSAIGFLLIGTVTHGVTAGYADAYSTYSSMSTWTNNFLGFFNNWLSLLGVSAIEGEPLVSLDSIINMIRIAGAFLLLAAPVVLLCRYNKIKNPNIRALLIGHFAICAFIIFATVFGKLGGANWRLVPMLGSSVILSFVCAIELIGQKKVAARVGVLLLAFLIILGGVSAFEITSMPSDYGRENSWHVVADELEERGLKYGYANFWWAEAVTMFSDGNVTVANLYPDQKKPTQYNYQIPKNSYADRDTDRYFLLLTESENIQMANYITKERIAGNISEEFIIESEPYNLRGYSGSQIFVYVFPNNIF